MAVRGRWWSRSFLLLSLGPSSSAKRYQLTAAQFFQKVPRQLFVNLAMSRHGLPDPGLRVLIPVVLRTVPDEDAAESLDLLDQLGPLHETINSSTLRIPGSSPLAMSR